MTREELDLQLSMEYKELVRYLLDKYGIAKYDYFCNAAFRSKNEKVRRTSEGLFCHHIDEDKCSNLNKINVAQKKAFEMQKADRLVYCTYLEHLILHIKIFENFLTGKAEDCGLGIAVYFIPELNNFYENGFFTSKYNEMIAETIKDDFDNYIIILKYLWEVAKVKIDDSGDIRQKKELIIGTANTLWQNSPRVYEILKEFEPKYSLILSKDDIKQIIQRKNFTDVFLHKSFIGKTVLLVNEESLKKVGEVSLIKYEEIDFKEYKHYALKRNYFDRLEDLSKKNPQTYKFYKYYTGDIKIVEGEFHKKDNDGRYLIWTEYYE